MKASDSIELLKMLLDSAANPKSDADYYSDANTYSGASSPETAEARAKADALEATGWENWLLTLFPFAFEEDFSDDHRKFWDLRWKVLQLIKEQKKYFAIGLVPKDKTEIESFFREKGIWIEDKEYVTLLILGRGLAKSSSIEASAVMRGAILGDGYCLYVCEAQDQANEHIGNCKGLILNDESRLTEFYPAMAIVENATVGGIKTKDRADIFITVGGWICRAKGLKGRFRGLRVGNKRPDDIKLDDIDGVNDSIAVSVKKLKDITASLIPTQARRWATLDFGQNLVNETGTITQVHTGKSDAFGERTVIGVTNTFKEFREGIEYQTYFDEADGRVKHKILPAAEPTWAGVDIPQAQKFLNDSGLETFLAEYQNSFKHLQTEKVFHEYNEARHVIGWSDFERVFGSRYIPPHWKAKASADLGYSKESLSAWMFTASAAQNSPLPGRYFCYRAPTFCQDSIDDQAVALWEEMFPDAFSGKNHFEATQSFAEYPELVRLLNTKPRCRDLLKNFTYNPRTDSYQQKKEKTDWRPNISDEEKAMYYVKEAEKTFRSQIMMWVISHEKTGEQKTLAQKYGIPCQKVKEFKADSGVAEANHLLKGDYTVPHPFYEDEPVLDGDGEPTGLWKLGCPYIFFVVDDRQVKAPRDDRGMKTFREQVANQRWTQEKLTELGLTRTIPMKYQSDCGDAFRMWAVDYALPPSEPLTPQEVFIQKVENINPDAIIKEGEIITPERQMSIEETHSLAAELTAFELGALDDDVEYEVDEELTREFW